MFSADGAVPGSPEAHAEQHPSDAGALLEPSTGVPAAEWAAAALGKLEHGHAVEVVLELRDAWWASGNCDETRIDDLRVEAGYFERNQDAVATPSTAASAGARRAARSRGVCSRGVGTSLRVAAAATGVTADGGAA